MITTKGIIYLSKEGPDEYYVFVDVFNPRTKRYETFKVAIDLDSKSTKLQQISWYKSQYDNIDWTIKEISGSDGFFG